MYQTLFPAIEGWGNKNAITQDWYLTIFFSLILQQQCIYQNLILSTPSLSLSWTVSIGSYLVSGLQPHMAPVYLYSSSGPCRPSAVDLYLLVAAGERARP